MENTSTNSAYEITKSKMGDYHSHDYDFVGAEEITVTITLAEYRALLESKSSLEVSKAEANYLKEYRRANELQSQLNAIKELMPCVNESNKEE